MRTADTDTFKSPLRRSEGDVWEIALTLGWCEIRITLPSKGPHKSGHAGQQFDARQRSAAMAEPSPRAGMRPQPQCRPSAMNGWRR